MSGVAINPGSSGGRHSDGVVVPLTTADNLQNLARHKLLPLKQYKTPQRLKSSRDLLLLPLNKMVPRLRGMCGN